jgi:hypothetical protein
LPQQRQQRELPDTKAFARDRKALAKKKGGKKNKKTGVKK